MRTKGLVAAGVAATLALVMGACSTDGAKSDQSGGSSSSAKSGASLTIAKPDGPIGVQNNNPYDSLSSAMRLGYANSIYETLAIPNPVQPAVDPVPWLAESYEWNDDYTELDVKVRSGVKWSDGEDLTPDDVAFSLGLVKDNPGIDSAALGITDVSVDGDHVKVTFEDPMFVKTQQVLGQRVVPKHIWDGEDPATYKAEDAVGTGPYTITNYTTQSVELSARDDYWGGELAVPTLFFISYNDNTALTTALATGDVDWAQINIPDVQSVYVDKDPEHNVYWPAEVMSIDTMILNVTKPPFDDQVFRNAVNMVVDRDQHALIAREGGVSPLTNVTGIPTPVGDSFIAPEYKDKDYKVDVDGARALLEGAGYTWEGDTLMYPTGGEVTFDMTVPQGWNDYVTGISLIADSVKALGVEATVTTPDADSWWENRSNGDFDSLLHWTEAGATPYWLYYSQIGDGYLKPLGEAADYNFGRFEDDEMNALLDTYRTATSDDDRTKAMDDLEKLWVEKSPAIPIGNRPLIGEYNTRNYVGWPDEDDPYAPPDPTQIGQVLILTKLKPAE